VYTTLCIPEVEREEKENECQMGNLAWFPSDQEWGPQGGPALSRALCDTLSHLGRPCSQWLLTEPC
jgi:hypothetical protein